jgi:hypothetical protein
MQADNQLANRGNDTSIPGGKALRVTIVDTSAQPWNAGVNSIIKEALAKGDRIEAKVTGAWTPFRLKAKVATNLAAKKSRIALQLGYSMQVIDVGPILIVRNRN